MNTNLPSILKKSISLIVIFLMLITVFSVQVFATQSKSGNFNKNYQLTGNGATDMIEIAKTQVGKTQTQLGYTEPWCADFVCDCAKLAGQSKAIPAYGACEGLHDRIIKAGGSEIPISEAQPGDLWFGDWNHKNHYAHVEIIYSVGTKISSYGGNGGSPSQVKNHTTVSKTSFTNGGEIFVVVRPNYCSSSNIYSFNFNPNGGTMNSDNVFSVKYGQDFKIVNLTCTKVGCSFAGWNVKRNNDNTWYVAGVGWCTENQINQNGYYKKVYSNNQICQLDTSWINGISGDGSYTFYATWNEENKIVDLGNIFTAAVYNAGCGKPLTFQDYNIVISKDTAAPEQQWIFRKQENGAYTVGNVAVDRYWDDENYGEDGANLCPNIYNGSTAQQWYIIQNKDESYSFTPVCNNCVIDITDSNSTDGTNVQLWTSNGSDTQKWIINIIDYQSQNISLVTKSECDGHTYEFYNGQMPWISAKLYAENKGGHLMVVNSEQEQNIILSYWNEHQTERLWLGATDENNEGVWENINGEKFIYSNWYPDEPNNYLGIENYVGTTAGNYWNDYPMYSNEITGLIIEYDFIFGDVSGDGQVDAQDLIVLKKALLTDSEYSKISDVNDDGVLNILDFVRLKKLLADAKIPLEKQESNTQTEQPVAESQIYRITSK